MGRIRGSTFRRASPCPCLYPLFTVFVCGGDRRGGGSGGSIRPCPCSCPCPDLSSPFVGVVGDDDCSGGNDMLPSSSLVAILLKDSGGRGRSAGDGSCGKALPAFSSSSFSSLSSLSSP